MSNEIALGILGFEQLETLDDNSAIYIVSNNKDYHIRAGQLKQLLVSNLPPAELPPGTATVEELLQVLNERLGSEEFAAQINAVIAERLNEMGANLVQKADYDADKETQTQINTDVEQRVAELENAPTVDLTSYVTVDQISEMFENFNPALPSDVVRTADLEPIQISIEVLGSGVQTHETEIQQLKESVGQTNARQDIQDQAVDAQGRALQNLAENFATATQSITEVDLKVSQLEQNATNFATREDLEQAVSSVQHPNHDQRFEAIEDRLHNQEQNPGVTVEVLNQAIAGIQVPDVSGLASKQEVEQVSSSLGSLATKEELAQVAASIPNEPDLSPLATKTELQEAIEGIQIPEVPDVSGFATRDELQEAVSGIQIPTDLVTETKLQEALAGIEHPTVDLSGHATKQELQEAVDAIQIPEVPDVSGFATREDVQQAVAGVQVPDVSGLASKEEVQAAIEGIEFPEAPDVSGFATKTEVQDAVAGINIPEVPDVSGFATREDVQQAVEEIEFPAFPDLTGFATKQEVQDAVSSVQVPDVTGFATREDVQQAVAGIEIPAAPDLTNYATKDEIPDVGNLVTQNAFDSALQEIEQSFDARPQSPETTVSNAVLAWENEKLVNKAMQLGRVYYVNPTSNAETPDGSLFAPFKTIQAALNAATAVSVINLAPGSYTEDLTVTKDNLIIQGVGCTDSHLTSIAGTITVGSESRPTQTRFRMKDVQLKNAVADKPALVFAHTQGRHYFHNVTVEPIAGTSVPLVQFNGPVANWIDFMFCNIGGEVLLDGTPTNASVTFRHPGHAATFVNMQADYTLIVHGATRFKNIRHDAGTLSVTNSIGFVGDNGTAIESTANEGAFGIMYTSFMAADMAMLKINKTGSCPGMVAYCVRNSQNDVLTGDVTTV